MPRWIKQPVASYDADLAKNQASRCWQAIYIDPQLNARFSVAWYAVQAPGDVLYGLEAQAELLLCRDLSRPGDTETWSGVGGRTLPGVFESADTAYQAAAREIAHRHGPRDISWDGTPQYR